MKLIVGLGNPGEKYRNNRHNVGYMFIDYFINELTASRPNELREKNMLHVTCYMLKDLILAKPLTFMNKSGAAVKKTINNYQLAINNLIIVHDDLDIPLGKFKIQQGQGPKLHNGITSIEQHLKTKDFWRVRIGVDNRMKTGWIDGETYTLQDFRPDEKAIVSELFPKILARLKTESLSIQSTSEVVHRLDVKL